MNDARPFDPAVMASNASQAAALMRALSNERRLLLLCHLISVGELSVGQLADRVGLSQPALSQHLAKLREEGLVDFRREAQTLFYRVADERTGKVLDVLQGIFCPELARPTQSGNSRMSAASGAGEGRETGE